MSWRLAEQFYNQGYKENTTLRLLTLGCGFSLPIQLLPHPPPKQQPSSYPRSRHGLHQAVGPAPVAPPHPLPRQQLPVCPRNSGGSHWALVLAFLAPFYHCQGGSRLCIPGEAQPMPNSSSSPFPLSQVHPYKAMPQCIMEKASPHSLRIQLSHQSHWAHTDYTGTCPYKDTPARPG